MIWFVCAYTCPADNILKSFFEKVQNFFEIRLKKEIHLMRCVSRERLCRSLLYLWRVLIVALVTAVMLVMLLRAPF